MATAQAMEEELQQSVMLSEDDGAYETADTAEEGSTINAAFEAVTGATRGSAAGQSNQDADMSDRDASGEEIEYEDEDASGEEDHGPLSHHISARNDAKEDDSGEDDEDVDAEGEDVEEAEEGVGAVKIKPGASDDEEDVEEDAESDISDAPSNVGDDSSEEEDEEEAAWEEPEVGEDEESDTGHANICIFCKETEENDPSEDFEAFLGCSRCGGNAHQQCARDAAAMSEENHAKIWRCPDCYSGDSDLEDQDDQEDAEHLVDEDVRPESQGSDGSKPTQNWLVQQNGTDDAESQLSSVPNEDTEEGSRSLRKRKSSSIEPDENVVSLRKRRKRASIDLGLGDDAGHTSEQTRSVRGMRLKAAPPPPVTVEKRTRNSLIMKIQVRSGNLKEILSRKKREKKRAVATPSRTPRPPAPRSVAAAPAPVIPISALPTPFTTDSYSQPFYSFFDKETDEARGKPYGGILSEGEADTSKTVPTADDRRRFDQAKQKAEDEWRARILAMQAEADVPVRKPKKVAENASQIECIEFGGWEIDTWYAAPYPAEYSRNRVLYICEFCLKYMNSDYVAWRHKLKCGTKHPPGDEIYRYGSVSVFEVDGRKNPVYCQNLCLLAKLFLGSKTLYYDVEPFLFYVLCEYDECGYHFVGYFSKEKRASSQNNVSCILTLPIHQRKGYGNLLIDFSYLLTKVEEKTGSPEKPLSDMGLVSYRNYWRLRLCQYFIETMEAEDYKKEGLSVKQISDDTGMTADDVIAALEGLRALVRDPQTKLYAFRVDLDYCRQYVAKWESKGYVKLDPEALAWTPYVMGRSNAVNFELGPPINTIAPREDDEARVQEGPNSVGALAETQVNGDKKAEPEPESEASEAEADGAEPPVTSIEKVAAEDKENASPEDESTSGANPDDPDAWSVPYKNIPPNRFEIFPPANRRDRSRQGGNRPSISRTASSASRPRPRRPGGSARKSGASRPKSSSSRRKSGGTGRGPGRWPKGTKKSDYGNAASGPGLPPGWKKGDAIDGLDPVAVAQAMDEEDAQDEVQVAVAVSRTAVNGTDEAAGDGSAMEEDVDAEGEDE